MTDRRTVWYISKYVSPPQAESVGGRAYELMRELAAMGHRSVIVTSDANHLTQVPELNGPVLRQHRDGLDMYWLRTFKAPLAKSWQRIASWLHFEWRLLRFDTSKLPPPDAIIVSSLSLLTILNGLRLRRRHRARLVFEIRDIWPLTLVEEGGYAPGNLFVRALGAVERLGYRRSDLIVGTMPALDRHVREVLGEEREVRCVPMGFSARVEDVRAGGPPPPPSVAGDLVVGYAGTIGATNALEVLLDAARLLRDDPAIRFRVVGGGPLLTTFQEEYADLASVTWVPQVRKDEVRAQLHACDLLYLSTYPSRVWEFGQSLNKLIDYMLSGRPVLASYDGYPSMIDEAGCGTFVPAGDATAVAAEIRRLRDLPVAERERMGVAGRDWILENRSYERLAADYLAALFPDPAAVG